MKLLEINDVEVWNIRNPCFFFSETQPLAVETKVSCGPTGESSPRSDQSADKSGDSGISGDHANSDPRLDSPAARHHVRIPISYASERFGASQGT